MIDELATYFKGLLDNKTELKDDVKSLLHRINFELASRVVSKDFKI
jgi:hypothetical protein